MPITYHKPKHVPGKYDYGFYEFSECSIGLTIVTKDIKILSKSFPAFKNYAETFFVVKKNRHGELAHTRHR
ncbi:MAG: hypothetical protein LBF88_00220 [Planctomycetaceae bacterium]|jgi:hypothetical protein|nr:hypothetical protein [Planctomycetaceae bacterium]